MKIASDCINNVFFFLGKFSTHCFFQMVVSSLCFSVMFVDFSCLSCFFFCFLSFSHVFFCFLHCSSLFFHVLMQNMFCGNLLGLIRRDMWLGRCWVGQRRTWHETDDGYLWTLVGMDLNFVTSVTVLLTENSHLANLPADVWIHSD